MKLDRRCLILLLCSVILFCSGTGAAAEAVRDAEAETSLYRDLLLSFDYGDTITYVIGHKSPDSDTVGSAMAYAYLLNEIGIPAQAVVSAPVNNETAYALGVFGIEAPPVMDHAEGKQFVLVDHSSYTQAIDGMRDARVVGILDHHGISDVAVSELIHVRSAPIGATATLVYLSYVECQVEIPREMAQVMLMALLSDTRDLDKQVTLADRLAYDALAEIAGIADLEALYRGMTEALSDYSGMTDLQIFLSDYKEYEVNGTTFGIADTRALSDPAARDLADRMIAVMEEHYEELGLDMLFAMIKNVGDDEPEHPMYMAAYGEGAEMLMQKVFTMPDGSGYYVFDEIYSRKTDVVPALTDALN